MMQEENATVDEVNTIDNDIEDQSIETINDPTEQDSSSKPIDDTQSKKNSGASKRINQLIAEREKLKRQLAQQDSAKSVSNAVEDKAPEIPARPDDDLKDDDYSSWQKQMDDRETALAQRAAWLARKEVEKSNSERIQNERQSQLKDQHKEIVSSYVDNAIESGLSEETLAQNEKILANRGVDGDLGEYLYTHPDGPKIVDYLAKNQSDLDSILNLPPLMAAERIATDIRSKAMSKLPSTTNAPDPIEPTKSNNPVPDDFGQLAQGYTFE